MTNASADFVSMEDFIFGTLATDDLRVQEIIKARKGIGHEARNLPRDVHSGQDTSVFLQVTAGPAAPLDKVFVHITLNGDIPSEESTTFELLRGKPHWDTLLWSYVDNFSISLPTLPTTKIVRYRISGLTYDGLRLWAMRGDHPETFSYLIDDYSVPLWGREGIMYHIFVDRFAPNPDQEFAKPETLAGFFGGTFKGITSKLDYFVELGVTTLWLSPIFPSPSHHGYDYTDLKTVNTRFGTETDFRELVDSAHRRGLKLILDFVPNHLSNEHTLFESAISDPQSPDREYFTFTDYPNEYESFFGVKSLPQINNEYLPARQYVIDSAMYWMKEFGVDGYRLDYALGPSHDFWTDYYRAMKATTPESYHFGELVETPAMLASYEGVMDGALDFLLLQAIRKLFAFGTFSPADFEQYLSRHEAYFKGRNFVLPTFLDNHDMNRFLWVARGNIDKLKQAAICQFTLSAPPIIYYGTEVGLSQNLDTRQGSFGILEEARLPMLWGASQNTELFNFYKHLIAFRKRSVFLTKGTRRAILIDSANGKYAYTNENSADPTQKVLAVFNFASNTQSFALPEGTWQDIFTEQNVQDTIRLDAFGATILEKLS